MSSQRGNVQRSRPQKHKNATVFKNDKYDSSSRTKKINSKLHDGVCQRCKDVLAWKVKFSKYKPLSQPKKCVKCLQKTVKDAYRIICKPCAIEHELCAKCGKKEDIVDPIVGEPQKDTSTASKKADQEIKGDDDLDFDIDLEASDDEFPEEENKEDSESACKNTTAVKS
ncbi:PREDICTED: uncharacterized protein C9orf85 homolog [Nanorana parkeri]|uniref:uncharacterized protein C9orf85 homolog n=1 Tax=Nanorana parkeri TaxID=125878 RepID=UPI000854B814|nr:PREDICTED: uncharacterized protein C9orf85 homolog [Nanorana parkeri]